MKANAPKVPDKLAAVLSPGQKASKTARWALTMTKWLITHSGKAAVKWRLVEFGGITGSESRGIVDILAIRKNHKELEGVKRGDLFELVLIQTKGGSAARPSTCDIERLHKVAEYYHAKEIVLVEWKIGKMLNLYRLDGQAWKLTKPADFRITAK